MTATPTTRDNPTEADSALALRTARNAASTASAQVAGKVATLLYTVVAARVLTQDDYGAFAYALSVSVLLASLPDWGFDTVLSRRASADPDTLAVRLSEALLWKTVLAVPVFAVGAIVLVAQRPSPAAATALLMVLAATLLEVYQSSGIAAAGALQRQGRVAVAVIVRRIVTAAAALVALASGYGLVGLAAAYLGGSVVGALTCLVAVRSLDIGTALRAIRAPGLWRTARESALLGLFALIGVALFRLDQVMLAAMKDDAAVATYAVSYRLLETVLFVAWSVCGALFPVFSAARDPATVRRGLERGITVVGVAYVPFTIVAVLAAPAVLGLVYGDTYAATSAGSLQWLGLSALPFAVGFLAANALIAHHDDTPVLLVSAGVLALNVVLNLLLIPGLAGTGAAIATTVTYAAQAVVMLVLARRAIGAVDLRRVLALPLVAGGGMGVTLLLARTVLPVPAAVVVAAGAYAVAWLALARRLDPAQLRVIEQLIPRRRRTAA